MDMETRKEEVVNPLPNFVVKKHGDKDPEKEFRNIGEYFWAISARHFDHRSDKRLEALTEQREQSFGTGSAGGFALPEQFKPEIWNIMPQEAIVKPRATVLPAGSPPDAKLIMPSLDQTAAQNIYGGVVMTHSGEAVTLIETDMKLRQITMEPKKIGAYLVCTNELLNNWDACSSFISGQLTKARVGQEDYDFLRGDGVNKSLGVINSPAAVTYARATASLIDFVDIYGMLARFRGSNPVWLGSQTIIPELASMTDAGTHAVWLGGPGGSLSGAQGPLPSTLMGIPLVFVDRLPALGAKGDLMLVDLSAYLIKEGSGPDVAISTELYFLTDRVIFRVTWRVDGKPWMIEPIGLEGATTSTVSPFVILGTP
jgi:HK97 family phage major capsid protein